MISNIISVDAPMQHLLTSYLQTLLIYFIALIRMYSNLL